MQETQFIPGLMDVIYIIGAAFTGFFAAWFRGRVKRK